MNMHLVAAIRALHKKDRSTGILASIVCINCDIFGSPASSKVLHRSSSVSPLVPLKVCSIVCQYQTLHSYYTLEYAL